MFNPASHDFKFINLFVFLQPKCECGCAETGQRRAAHDSWRFPRSLCRKLPRLLPGAAAATTTTTTTTTNTRRNTQNLDDGYRTTNKIDAGSPKTSAIVGGKVEEANGGFRKEVVVTEEKT